MVLEFVRACACMAFGICLLKPAMCLQRACASRSTVRKVVSLTRPYKWWGIVEILFV